MSSANSELNASLSSNSSQSENDIAEISGNESFEGNDPGLKDPLSDLRFSGEDRLSAGIDEESLLAEEKTGGSTGEGLFPIMTGCALAAAFIVASVAILLNKKKKKRKKREDMDYESTYEPYRSDGTDPSVKVLLDEAAAPFRIGRIHAVGKRSMQQDSFGISDTDNLNKLQKKGIMAVVADGMGGLTDGERMSQMVVVKMLQGFDQSPDDAIPSSTLLGLVGDANNAVNEELGQDRLGKCGSTVVAVILKDRQLSWISVGDSHIYVYRKGQLIQLNTDHNYGTQLDEMAERGEISYEEAGTDPQRAALTSFIGIGELELIGQNEKPIAMERGDRILLMSDGVYGTVDEQAISEIMALPFKKALSALDRAVLGRDKSNQDNYTCVMLEVR